MTINWIETGAIVGALGLAAGFLKATWAAIKTFEGMRHSLHTIATNDLPHIYAELRDIRGDFLNYIREESLRGQDTAGFRRGDREDPTGSGHYPPNLRGSVRESGDEQS